MQKKINLTGNKLDEKHIRHTGYPGGQKRLQSNATKNPALLVEKKL
jgi:ribosomal protein L13